MSFLLDTNVLSEPRKRRPDPHVVRWFDDVAGNDLYLSVLVLGEVRQGIENLRRREGRAAEALDDWLHRLRREFSGRILDVTPEVADRWGAMNAGDPLPAVDGLLAATAAVHGLTLVTRNLADVERSGVTVLNPFDPPLQ